MDKSTICEAMYALQGGVVVRRSKSLIPSIAVMAVGVALVVLYYMNLDHWSNNLASSVILVAGGTLLIGLLMCCTRLMDKEGRPVLARTGETLRYVERYFPIERRGEIQRYIEEGSLKRLFAAPDGQVLGIAVAIYHSADQQFAAVQAYEYVDFEYRPVTEVKIIG